ncbi:unnamed protein product [Strongylus vulgaris]|uniref:Peptidase C1A papain C-terminal domain-containing protein n=1 Tax=Strongylus vulgaris TaxID=40348 RepID=A0A3P7IGZ2_STRVU|nr:unnamed protein product [Strongylus vulgaris]
MTEKEERRRLMDERLTLIADDERAEEIETDEPIPTSFDARTEWPFCESIKTIRDQSACGSCWAVSAASAMSDRICVQTKGRKQVCRKDYVLDIHMLSR